MASPGVPGRLDPDEPLITERKQLAAHSLKARRPALRPRRLAVHLRHASERWRRWQSSWVYMTAKKYGDS
jgi:hypothetical protein